MNVPFSATVQANPIEFSPRVPDKKVIGGGGIFIEPLNILSSLLNFTINLTASIDNKWGGVNEEGIWNGMIGMVVRGEADIAAASLTREAIQKPPVAIIFDCSFMLVFL